LQYAASYDPSRPLMGWVKTILRNALYDSRRHDRLIVSLDLPSDVGDGLTLADSLADSADPVEVRMEQEGGNAALLQAVAELPKETRSVVTLCDLEGLTYEAAAAQLGIPLGTVRSRLSRGRQVLREKVGQLDFA
jgi:RNA polymerase sigma-70 factor (ECF subfamily)